MNFVNVKDWTIPEGTVKQVTDSLGRVIWEKPTQADEYFYIENLSSSQNQLTVKKQASSAPSVTLYYSSDKTNWTSVVTTTTNKYIYIPANSKIYFKSQIQSLGNNYGGGLNLINNQNAAAGGNIMSLLYGDNFSGATALEASYTFSGLFINNSYLISAEKLILPATTLKSYAYYNMFRNCTALTTAPEILPATTLAQACYYNMFTSCRSLLVAPELKGITLATQCYYNLFSGCSSLNSITTYANNISASNCLYDWLNGVAATGTFHNLGTATYPTGTSGIPSGWTEVNS